MLWIARGICINRVGDMWNPLGLTCHCHAAIKTYGQIHDNVRTPQNLSIYIIAWLQLTEGGPLVGPHLIFDGNFRTSKRCDLSFAVFFGQLCNWGVGVFNHKYFALLGILECEQTPGFGIGMARIMTRMPCCAMPRAWGPFRISWLAQYLQTKTKSIPF